MYTLDDLIRELLRLRETYDGETLVEVFGCYASSGFISEVYYENGYGEDVIALVSDICSG